MPDIVRHYSIVGGHILQVAARSVSLVRPRGYRIIWEAVQGYITRPLADRLRRLPATVQTMTASELDDMVRAAAQGDLIDVTSWAPAPKDTSHDHGAEDDWSGRRS